MKLRGEISKLYWFRACANKQSFVHRLMPMSKLLVLISFILAITSLDKYEVTGLIGFLLCPILLMSLGELPYRKVLGVMVYLLPLFCGMGIFNFFFEASLAKGMASFCNLAFKGILTTWMSLVFMLTTPIEKLVISLERYKVPKVFLMLFMLIYRYIFLLLEEMGMMMAAYELRAPGQKGLHYKTWGTFLGQLLMRTYRRSNALYESMLLRGFDGKIPSAEGKRKVCTL